MNAIARRLSLRKSKKIYSDKHSITKKEENVSSAFSLNNQRWSEDDQKVLEGTCSFQVKYLGSVEVFESRGVQICEEAISSLMKQRSVFRFFRKRKSLYQRAILHISGDNLRVVDEISKGLLVDQTIEKVSFCGPDRYHKRAFAYICRDATTRRWLCQCFLAQKETGERLSHAIGCAFQHCLEMKQSREKEAASTVEVEFTNSNTVFTRYGSFKTATIDERIIDPQLVKEVTPIAKRTEQHINDESTNSVPRPRASIDMLQKQNSLRLFPKLSDNTNNTPFKRELSLRLQESVTMETRLKNPFMLNKKSSLLNNPTANHNHHHINLAVIHDDLLGIDIFSEAIKEESPTTTITDVHIINNQMSPRDPFDIKLKNVNKYSINNDYIIRNETHQNNNNNNPFS